MRTENYLRLLDKSKYALPAHCLRTWVATQGKPYADLTEHEHFCRKAAVAAVVDLSPQERELVTETFSQRARFVTTSLAVKRAAESLGISLDKAANIMRRVFGAAEREID